MFLNSKKKYFFKSVHEFKKKWLQIQKMFKNFRKLTDLEEMFMNKKIHKMKYVRAY